MKICIILIFKSKLIAHMCGFGDVWRGNYFGGELVTRTEVGVIKGKLKSGKSPSKYDVTREMINSSVEMNLKAV